MRIEKERIITKSIVLGFGLLLFLLSCGGFFFLNQIDKVSKLTYSIYHHPLVVSNTSLQCSLSITKMHRTMKDIILFSDPSMVKGFVKQINHDEKQVYADLDLINKKILGGEGKILARQANQLFRDWKPIRDEVIALASNRNFQNAALITREKGTDHVAIMESKMFELSLYAQNKASGFMEKSEEDGRAIKSIFYIFFSLSVILSIIIGIVTMTISLKAENSLIRSEHQQRVIFEKSPLGMIRFSPDGTIADLNENFVDLMGSSREKLLGFNTAEQSLPEMRKAIKQALKGEASVYEGQYTSITGNKIIDIRVVFNPVSPGETITEVIATLEDITERKKTEKKLHENEKRLQVILDSVQTGIFLIDKETRTIVDINPAAARMIGETPENIKGKSCHRFVCPAEQGKCPIIDLGQMVDNSERVLITADGRQVPILKTVSEVSINGRPCLLECFVDISRQKEIEDVLREAKEAAESATRSKAAFLANMSHEIRTPMNGVIGMTELLSGTKLNPEQQDYAKIIKISGESLLTIINDILDYSKIEAGKIEFETIEFNLRTVLEGVADLSAIKAQEKGLEYCTIIHPKVPWFLFGDPGRLRQILLNLIGNAVKFTENGEIVISVRLEEETKAQAIVHFTVADTGIGIPEDKQKALFDSFSQVDASTTRKYGGTGLGLAISKQLSELMGGQMGVSSQEGKGTDFWFSSIFEKPLEDHQKEVFTRQDIKGKHILIVDDNKTNRFVLCEDLKLWGCRFDEAANGKQALEKLKNAMDKKDGFEIAIIDMQMPQMDGETLGRKIKQDPELEKTILIMLTSMGSRGDVKRLKEIGFSAYIAKPIKQSSLYDCLATVHHVSEHTLKNASSRIITRHSIAENQKQKTRILLAEDNRINQKVALGLLGKLGFMADAVITGKEAVQALKDKRYDLVLMDCQMPEMDGYQATAQIRSVTSGVLNPDVTIIAMTANAMEEDREKCINAGMNDYLAKPVKLKDLSHMLEKYSKG